MNATEKRAIHVLIADDHEVVRVGLRTLLEPQKDIEIVGDAATVAQAKELADKTEPDVLLVDVRMGGSSGAEVCRHVKQRRPNTGVLFLTSFADDDTIFEAISAGADGYLLKEVDSDHLIQAIKQVASGQSILDPMVTRRVMGRLQAGSEMSAQNKLDLLSAQERRVLALVAEGKTNKEIAMNLGLSDKTVKNYLANAMDKLKMSRRSQAAAFYVRHCES